MDDFDIIVGGSLNGYFCHFKCKIAVQPRIYYIVAGHTPALGAYPFIKLFCQMSEDSKKLVQKSNGKKRGGLLNFFHFFCCEWSSLTQMNLYMLGGWSNTGVQWSNCTSNRNFCSLVRTKGLREASELKNVTKSGKSPQFSWPPPPFPRMFWTFLNLGKM